jgi:hypothetical protein
MTVLWKLIIDSFYLICLLLLSTSNNHHHHWFYSLLQALTSPTTLFHWLRSCALLLHPWIPRTHRSCSTLSSHLIGGLPFFLLPSILVNVTFLHGSVSLARYRCPNHLSLPAFITLIVKPSSYVGIVLVIMSPLILLIISTEPVPKTSGYIVSASVYAQYGNLFETSWP